MPNWRNYVVPALFLALVAALGLSYFEGRKAGAYAVRFHAADSTVAILRSRIPKTDSVFVHDTVRLTVVRHRTDSLLRVDTLVAVDTVRQLVQAERNACDAVVSSCTQKVAVRDSLIAAQNQKIKLLLHQPHSFFSGIGGKALILGGGFLLGRALH